MSKERYDYIVAAYADMEEALAAAEIRVPPGVVATLIAADELHNLSCYVEYRGV